MIKNILKKILLILRKIRTFYFTYRVKQRCQSYGQNLKVHAKSTVSKNTILGNNVNFNGMRIKGRGRVEIGDNFHSGENCSMISQVHNYDHGNAIPYDNTYIVKDICIEDNVWIGDSVIILGGVTIGEGTIIQAGSVVVSDIPKYTIAGGHPAKVFGSRDKEHYLRLKQEGRFH